MATYYPTSNNQRDAVPMLYLREPLPGSYPEAPVLQGNMMMYMNYPSSSATNSDTLPGNSHQIDIPSMGDSNTTIPQQEILSNLGGSRLGEHEMLFMHPMGGGLQGQGLSLSLSTQIPMGIQIPSIQYRNPNQGFSSFLSPNSGIRDDDSDSLSKQPRNGEYFPQNFPGGNGNHDSIKGDSSAYGFSSSISRNIPNSKYLKAAQQLLDEVVNVRKALKQSDSEKTRMKGSKEIDGGSKNETALPLNPQESSSNSTPELSPAERQDLQNKMTKLLSMLDEVDRRYKQYYHQMQIVVSSFDVIAGSGSAKPYTALALQTISRHFRCLRDAIYGQIRAARKSLGEQETSGSNAQGVGISRLRYVDQQLRQQRALQQLGMMQPHAWRPQRGLPESSVSILRAWLFEHFLHPYPKDSDKIMLARQTGLTRSQVSNWFINARVRLWKPMVEEMYKEEIGDAELDSNSSSEHAGRPTKGDAGASEDRGEDFQQTATSKSDYSPDIEMGGYNIRGSRFQSGARGESEPGFGVVKFRDDQRPGMDESTLFADGVMQYHMSELGRFGGGSGISLTLGLQHCESMSGGAHHGFVAMQGGDDVYVPVAASGGPETEEFECVDPDNRQQQFASTHMLHDFVA